MIIEILNGIFIVLIGVGILKYRKEVKGWTGNFMWAERFFGRGGTYIIIILFGMFLILLGTLWPFGGLELLIPKK